MQMTRWSVRLIDNRGETRSEIVEAETEGEATKIAELRCPGWNAMTCRPADKPPGWGARIRT